MFISILVIPIVIGRIHLNPNSEISYLPPIISDFSKDDYTPILSEEKYSLGNISINDIDLSALEEGFKSYNDTYPLIGEDIYSGALNVSQVDNKFVETIEPAIKENLKIGITDRDIITVKINESLYVEYDNPQAGYFIYHARLNPSRLKEIYVNNGSDIIELTNETDYIIDDNDFIVFNFDEYFPGVSTNNFTMDLIWEYDIILQLWELFQDPVQNPDLIMTEAEQNFTVRFTYNFILAGRKFGGDINQVNVYADNIDIALIVNLPDRNLLNDHILELNNVTVNINTHLNENKSIEIFLSDAFSADQSLFSLNFTSVFTLKFISPVGKTWAIDRLVALRDIRERIYLLSLINGPKHIYLKDLSFYEPTIFIEQILSSSSLFERHVGYIYMNTSITGREGIKVLAPYLIAGETCPLIIKYISTQTLIVVITDNIKMPLVGASVEVFYCNKSYGTYISNDKVQPISPGTTNEFGEIILNDVPHGNYTVRIYMNGIIIKESIVNPENNINYIYTNYPHFPLWIIIFAIINGIILIVGVVFYLKIKKMR